MSEVLRCKQKQCSSFHFGEFMRLFSSAQCPLSCLIVSQTIFGSVGGRRSDGGRDRNLRIAWILQRAGHFPPFPFFVLVRAAK